MQTLLTSSGDQTQGGDLILLTCYDDLTEHEKHSCDCILARLLQLNRTGKTVTDDTRKTFWRSVFHDRDTWKPVPWHSTLPPRSQQQTGFKVGAFRRDTPRLRPGIPGFTKSPAWVPAERRKGEPVYVEVNPNFLARGFTFEWTDAKRRAVNPLDLALRRGMSWNDARVESIICWDEQELERVGQYNLKVALFYARMQLLRHLLSRTYRNGCEGACSACIIKNISDMDRFHVIQLCGTLVVAGKLHDTFISHQKQPLRGPATVTGSATV